MSFAVDRETDVAVSIEDAKGKIIRHLAAGVLGRNAPPPLQKDSLTQDLVWDGRDDRGCQVSSVKGESEPSVPSTLDPSPPTPFRVRVSLGLRPSLGRIIGSRPGTLGGVRALAIGPEGNVYVFHCYGMSHTHDDFAACAVFSRDGKYLRTILPYPASLPEEKLKGIKRVEVSPGVKVPFIHQFETRSMIPGLGDLPRQRAVVTGDGRLAFVGVQEGPQPFAQAGAARLTVVHTDGSVPADGVLKTLIHPLTDTAASLALSPDEKTLYATGVRACTHAAIKPAVGEVCPACIHEGSTWEHTVPTRAVYRFGWEDARATVFAPDVAFKEPVSVATDKDGNVWVADLAGDRVAALKPDGGLLKDFKISQPQRVEVNRKTGTFYVLSGGKVLELVKLDSGGTEVARQGLPIGASSIPPRRPILALDDAADPPVLWMNGPLIRIEDRGASFGPPVRMIPDDSPDASLEPSSAGPGSIGSVMDLTLDRARGFLYVNNYWRYGTEDGKWERIRPPGKPMWPASTPASANGTMGLDGNYYVYPGGGAVLHRLTADMKPLPFPVSPDKEGTLHGFAKDFGYGHTADAQGNVYVLWKKCPADPGDVDRAHALYMYGPDGTLKKEKLVNADIASVHSVRVDFAGNIYLAAGLRPGASTLPPGLRGQLPEGPEDRDAVNGINGYPVMYGSIVKFGPEGGEIRKGNGGVPCNYAYGAVTAVKGAEWIFPGASPVASWKSPTTITACLCELPGLDVDGYGRSFFCDAGRFRVGVIDTAGNEIGWIGSYGNPDEGQGSGVKGKKAADGSTDGRPDSSRRPSTLDPSPIAFAWPQAVAVGDGHVYVGDRVNRRIVDVKLGYATEEVCVLP